MSKTFDPVTRPSHYNQGDVECIDAIHSALTPEEFRGYCKGNAVKYIWRELFKNGTEDIAKAKWYLDKIGVELKEAATPAPTGYPVPPIVQTPPATPPPSASDHELLKMFADGTHLTHLETTRLFEAGLIQSIDSGAATAITEKGLAVLMNRHLENRSDRRLIRMFAKGTKMTRTQLQHLVNVNLIYPDHNCGNHKLTSAGSYLLKELAK